MSKQLEFEKLDRIVRDGEIKIRTFKTQIDLLNKDIYTLTQLEGQLVGNIRFLKKNNVIATASEYKKSKDDLAKTVIRMITLKNDREHLNKLISNEEKIMQKAQKDLDKLKDGENNVVHGKFGRKNNG